ncbi:hypothetical protein [Pedobacter ginsengisoli]|jgi:hypothetical protein|uniref:hypothetical protein n=1 Tax=Pedobacter ginsengisoli TaxID=363852 RepID=UPI00254ACB74|nr:hypothetical protein [Pedobacter ginsengisoli]
MNNIKKTVLGTLIGLLVFGISAYTTRKKNMVFRYYKTDISSYPSANDPQGYQYFSDDRCEGGGSLCSAQWDIGSNPAPGEGDFLPLTGVIFKSNSVIAGHFE